MKVKEYRDRLYTLSVTCGMNHRYHQQYETWWGYWDKGLKAAVVILTVIGLIMSVPGFDYPWLALWMAVISAIAAFCMYVIPVGDWEKEHGEMHRLWNDLRSDCDNEELKYAIKEEVDNVQAHVVDRLGELQAKANSFHSMERAANDRFLRECYSREVGSRQADPTSLSAVPAAVEQRAATA